MDMGLKPVDQLVARADAILKGTSNTLEDWRDALEIYQQAGALGSGLAYSRLASMYFAGNGPKLNLEKAIQYFKKAVSLNSFDDYEKLIESYFLLREANNAFKSLDYFQSCTRAAPNIETDIQYYLNIEVFLRRDYYFSIEIFRSMSESILDRINFYYLMVEDHFLMSEDSPIYAEKALMLHEVLLKIWPHICRIKNALNEPTRDLESVIREAKVAALNHMNEVVRWEKDKEITDKVIESVKEGSSLAALDKDIIFGSDEYLLTSLNLIQEHPEVLENVLSELRFCEESQGGNPQAAYVYLFGASVGSKEFLENLIKLLFDYKANCFAPSAALNYLNNLRDVEISEKQEIVQDIERSLYFACRYPDNDSWGYFDQICEAVYALINFKSENIKVDYSELLQGIATLLCDYRRSYYNPPRALDLINNFPLINADEKEQLLTRIIFTFIDDVAIQPEEIDSEAPARGEAFKLLLSMNLGKNEYARGILEGSYASLLLKPHLPTYNPELAFQLNPRLRGD